MQQFVFTLETVAPVFMITFLGIFLKRIRLIDEKFVYDSSKLVFNVALPVLIFLHLFPVWKGPFQPGIWMIPVCIPQP